MLKYKRLKPENYFECKKIFEDIFDPNLESTDDEFESQWYSMLKYGRIYGIFYDDKLIGFCSWVRFRDDDYVTLCNLTIDKSLHRKGYGSRLVRYIINKIKLKNIMCHTNEREFFESVNFDIVVDFDDDDTAPYRYIMNYKKNI